MAGETYSKKHLKTKLVLDDNNLIIRDKKRMSLFCMDCQYTGMNVYCIYINNPQQKIKVRKDLDGSKPFMACSKCHRRIGARVKILCIFCDSELKRRDEVCSCIKKEMEIMQLVEDEIQKIEADWQKILEKRAEKEKNELISDTKSLNKE